MAATITHSTPADDSFSVEGAAAWDATHTVTGLGTAAYENTSAFAPALGMDDNYVTDVEKTALHAHSNKVALDAVSGTNTGDQDLSGYSVTSHAHTGTYEPANANIQTHISSTSNPHSVTATQVGLGNVTNESKATMFASPEFTGAATVAAGTDYTTAKLRNCTLSTGDPSGGANGDIWIKYTA